MKEISFFNHFFSLNIVFSTTSWILKIKNYFCLLSLFFSIFCINVSFLVQHIFKILLSSRLHLTMWWNCWENVSFFLERRALLFFLFRKEDIFFGWSNFPSLVVFFLLCVFIFFFTNGKITISLLITNITWFSFIKIQFSSFLLSVG